MYTNKATRFFLHAAVCGICLGGLHPAMANGVLASFDFDDALGEFENAPSFAASGLAVPAWSVAIGSISDFAGTDGRALAARNYLGGNALSLDITIAPGFLADLTGVTFEHVASGSGPALWSLAVNGSPLADGATPSAFEPVDAMFDLTGLSGNLGVQLLGTGATSNNGTYRIDNFTLHGSVSAVPVAPALVMLASGAAVLPLTGRRQRRAPRQGRSRLQ